MVILGILTSFLVAVALVLIIAVSMKRASATSPTTAPTTPLIKKRSWGWIGWLATGAGGIILLLAILGSLSPGTTPPAQQQAAPTKPETVREVVAPVGEWSENVAIPMLHWFRIEPQGKVRIKLWNGLEMDSEPGNDTWFGDGILDANFRFQSREDKPVTVRVVMRPK